MQLHTFEALTQDQAAHIVLDLETLSTQPNALVLSIGAVGLNKHGDILSGSEFHLALDQHAQQKRRHVDVETQRWWETKTCAEAKAASLLAPPTQQAFVENALSTFTDYIAQWSDPDLVQVWGNGCSFDNVILGSLFQDWNKRAPWKFWNDRDMRTITGIFPKLKLIQFVGIKHHALHDALHEAKQLSQAIPALQSIST
ncbi:3'-5' exonuclease [Comamonas aquatica]|uniref:3'-5' exonuclease n=1 Tax=Comamonas aquatica TaxID=225991 RepID=UPI0021B0F4B2|nr:3'-5' exonuclease [Comamonas aquatica]